MAVKKAASDENLFELKNFNPMEDDYNGHGTGHGVLPKNNCRHLFLCNVPVEMTTRGVQNLCSKYGKVVDIRHGAKPNHRFVDFANMKEMEAAYQGLQGNEYGLIVEVGRPRLKQDEFPNSQVQQSVSAGKGNIDFGKPENASAKVKRRKFAPPCVCPARPYIEKRKIVAAQDYERPDNDLRQNDPQKYFLIEEDAHIMERAGVQIYDDDELDIETTYRYALGRMYREMPASLTKEIEQKTKQCADRYNESRNHRVLVVGEAKPPKFGYCVECGAIADQSCSKCLAWVCSVECLGKARPKHGLECHKGTRTSITTEENHAKQPEMTGDVKIVELPASGSLVAMMSFSKANLVYIRSKSDEEHKKFFKAINLINCSAKDLRKLQTPPRLGQIVVVKFHAEYCRAMILGAEDMDHINLVYIDYGNIGTERLSNLLEATDEIVNLPRCTMPVILKDVPDGFVTNEVRKVLQLHLEKVDFQLKYTANESVPSVELIDRANKRSLNKILVSVSTAKEPAVDQVYFRDHLTAISLPEGDDIELVVMDNLLISTGIISCTSKEGALQIMQINADVQRYGDSVQPKSYAPRIYELCIAKYKGDKKWYRASCVELMGDGRPTITYFDYGNLALVGVKDIRRYPKQMTFPVFTMDCDISGFPENGIDAKLVEKLMDLIPIGSVIRCMNVKAHADGNTKYFEITIPEVTKLLKDEGYLGSDITSLSVSIPSQNNDVSAQKTLLFPAPSISFESSTDTIETINDDLKSGEVTGASETTSPTELNTSLWSYGRVLGFLNRVIIFFIQLNKK